MFAAAGSGPWSGGGAWSCPIAFEPDKYRMAARASGKQIASREVFFISTSIRSLIETRLTVKKSRRLMKKFTERLINYAATYRLAAEFGRREVAP
jgi:hypothetical protein